MTTSFLVRHGFVATMEDMGLIEDGAVRVEGGFITDVGRDSDLRGLRAERVIDATGSITVPGFVNAHTHTDGDVLMRSSEPDMKGYGDFIDYLQRFKWPMLREMRKDDHYLGAILGYAENLLGGTTTVVDNYYAPRGTDLDGVPQAAFDTGVRSLQVRGYHDYSYLVPEDFLEDSGTLPGTYRALHRKWQGRGGGRIRVAVGPVNLLYCTRQSVQNLAALSEELNMPIHSHVSEVKRGVDVIRERHGKGYVEVFEELGALSPRFQAAHCVWLNEPEIGLLAARGASVIHNPASNMVLTDGVAPLPSLQKAGVNLTLGTDAILDMISAMRLAVMLQKVTTMRADILDASSVLQMATVNGARMLGLQDEIGSIKVGKRADLTIVNLTKPHVFPISDPVIALVYFAMPSDVETVIVDGNLVVENGRVTTVDVDSAWQKAQARVRELTASLEFQENAS